MQYIWVNKRIAAKMYVTNETSKTPIFQINQHIGFDKDILNEDGSVAIQGDGQGIDGKLFANEVLSFNDNPNVDELVFYINSQGGDVQQSFDIFNAISMSSKKTHAIITGLAYSCGGWIPLAADKVEMVNETGSWMCHMPYDPENPETFNEFTDAMYNNIAKVISSKSGKGGKVKKSIDEVKALLKAKTYYDAEQMEKEGLIDHKVNHKGKIIRFEKDPITLNKAEVNFYYKEFQSAQNKLISEQISISEQTKTINIMPFPKLINRLNSLDSKNLGFKINLSEDASEESVMDIISRIDNKFRALNDDMMDKEKIILDSKKEGEDIKNKMETAKKVAEDKGKEASDAMCQYNSIKESYDKMEIENKAMKTEKEEAANLAKEFDLKIRKDRAISFVNSLEKDGKISGTKELPLAEIKEHLINRATTDYEGIIAMYSSIQGKSIVIPAAKMMIGKMKNGETIGLNLIEKLKTDNMERIQKKRGRFASDGVTFVPFEN